MTHLYDYISEMADATSMKFHMEIDRKECYRKKRYIVTSKIRKIRHLLTYV